jgi:hypothetical protein
MCTVLLLPGGRPIAVNKFIISIAFLPWMLDLWSSRRTGSARWILSSGVTFAAVVLSFLDTILFNVRRSLSASFGFRLLVLVSDDVFPWFVYAVTTMETAAMDTPNTLAILVTYAPAKLPQNIWQFSHFAVLSYELLLYILHIHTTRYWIQSVMHWNWHYTA